MDSPRPTPTTAHLGLSGGDGRLGLLDDDLLGGTLLALHLKRLSPLELDLPWLNELDLPHRKQA